ncbi:hypothetical protein C8R45DRAFT_1135211 [Mycena sanguinolenta]|nr:hypothetical protein C8R45DRAFT_1135211 [Mycena sanguinolenta]
MSPPASSPPPLGFRTIPCTAIDLAQSRFISAIGLVINARLDPKRMEGILWKLVEHKFPMAGARLAFGNGLYEFQIPDKFDSQSPPFIFTVEEHSEIYGRSDTCPETLDGFVQSNHPALHIHVNAFDDLTFLGFIAPHIAFDLIGATTLLDGWTRLPRGEDIHTIDSDPEGVPRFVRVPKKFLDHAKQGIMAELKARGSTEYVGSGDVLKAWWLKVGLTVLSFYRHDIQVIRRRCIVTASSIHVHFLKNLRGLPMFANDEPLKDPYIHNAISTIVLPPIPVSAFQTESLGMLALRIRRSILAYNTDPEAIRADLRWCFAEANRDAVLFPCPLGGRRTSVPNGLAFFNAREARLHGVLMDDGDAVWMCETRGPKDWDDIRQASGVIFTDSPLLTDTTRMLEKQPVKTYVSYLSIGSADQLLRVVCTVHRATTLSKFERMKFIRSLYPQASFLGSLNADPYIQP